MNKRLQYLFAALFCAIFALGAASYPGSIKTFTTKVDRVDVFEAAHVNDLQNEVVAIQTELGTDPAGSATDVKTRLAVSIADSGGIQGGTSFPGSPVANQFFKRTDEDILYQRNAANDGWDALTSMANYSDGALVETTAATERSTSSATYVKLKELSPCIRGGTITVAWQYKCTTSGGEGQTKVYVNDIAVGTEKSSAATTYADLSEAGVTVQPGDVVQIYGKKGAANTVYVQNLQIKSANPTVPGEASGY